MSKNTEQKQKIILSSFGIAIFLSIASLFYLVDISIEDETSDDVIEQQINSNFPTVEEKDDYYLSEIEDLYSSLKEEVNISSAKTKHLETEEITDEVAKKIEEQKEEQSSEIVQQQDIIEETKPSQGKLVIIIDDVAFGYQVKKLKALNLPITLSFFPPDKNHPNTYKYAKEFPVYMVHFPLQAFNYHREEIDTLHTNDDFIKIKKRVDFILDHFPNLRFTNNHTGSKFTSNYKSMKMLMEILNERGVHFVDSVTTAKSVVPKLSKEMGLRYIRRNVFIDNKLEVSAILHQLQKAVKIAKKRGYAIAIGHPHKATIKALSKISEILDGVSVVYINKI